MTRTEGIAFRATMDTRRFNRGLSSMERRSKRTVGTLGGIFKGASGLILGGLAVGGITAGVSTIIGDFQDMENTVRKATGASGDALDELVSQVRRVAEEVPGSNEEIAALIGTIATELPGSAQDVGDLALAFANYERVAGGGSATTEGLTRVIKQFGLDVEGVSPFLDGLTVLQQQAAVDGGVLLKSLQRLGPSFTAMGYSVDESAAMIAGFEQRGISARRSASLFDQFLSKAASGGVTDLQGALQDTITEITASTSQTDKLAIANDAVGATYGALLVKMAETGAFAAGDLVGAFSGSEGATARMAAETLTLGERMELLGEKVLTALQPAITIVVDLLERLIDLIEPAINWIASFGTQVDDTSGSITERIEPFIKFLEDAWAAVQEVFAVVVEEYQKSAPQIEEFLSKLGELGQALVPIFQFTLVNAFRVIGFVLRVMLSVFSTVFNTITAIIEGAQDTFNTARDVISAVARAFTNAWQGARDAFRAVWQSIKDAAEAGVNFVIDRINSVIEAINAGIRGVNRFNPFGDLDEIEVLQSVTFTPPPAMTGSGSLQPASALTVNVDLQGATVLGSDVEEVIDKGIRAGAERGLTNAGQLTPATVRNDAYLGQF